MRSAGLSGARVAVWQDLYDDNHGRLDDALTRLLDEGKAVGEIRDDVDATDVILLLGALSRAPEQGWDVRARTLVAVIIDGLRRS